MLSGCVNFGRRTLSSTYNQAPCSERSEPHHLYLAVCYGEQLPRLFDEVFMQARS